MSACSSESGLEASSAPRRPPVVAVDVDEVLAHLIPAIAEFHNESYGTSFTAESFHDYAFHNVWGGTIPECVDKMEAFYRTAHFQQGVRPVQGALESLMWLKEQTGCELHIVTARQHSLETATRAWIDTHYKGVFSSITFGNHYGTEGKKRSKPEMCKDIGALCLIDDSQIYASQCAEAGIPCVLFGSYAWNRCPDKAGGEQWCQSAATQEYSHLVYRAQDWGSAKMLLRQIVQQSSGLGSGSGSGLGLSNTHVSLTSVASIFTSSGSATLSATTDFVGLSTQTNAQAASSSGISSSGGKPVIAAVQMNSGNDKQANLSKIRAFTSKAAQSGATLVCFPECCVFLGKSSAETVANAEPDDGPSVRALQAIAREYGVWISVGGLAVRQGHLAGEESTHPNSDKISNLHFVLDPRGEVRGRYSKIHLFDNPLTNMRESAFTDAGNEMCSVGTASGLFARVGLTICYDLRFPELFGRLCRSEEDGHAGGRGAEIVLVPSAFMEKTGHAHWETLLRARAIENQVYIVAAAQCGSHNDGSRSSFGHTLIVDPWGTVLDSMDGSTEGIIFAAFDREFLVKQRKDMPVQSHRRPDLY